MLNRSESNQDIMRPQRSWPAFLLASLQLVRPSHSLLDAGTPSDAESLETFRSAIIRQDGRERIVASTVTPSDSLVVQDTEQIGLRPGCRRSTDFFDQVCSNPSKGSEDAEGPSSSSSLAPGVRADLLVCDLPEVEPLLRPGAAGKPIEGRARATYAVSGTIVVDKAAGQLHPEANQLPELGTSPASGDKTQGPGQVADQGSATRPDASFPGPDDDGFWRQREGQHEWHPASDHVDKQSQNDQENRGVNAKTAHDPNRVASNGPSQPDASPSSEYDAWSAEQDQGAFLSFQEWTERHAAKNPGQARGPNSNTANSQAETAKVPPASSHSTAASEHTQTRDTASRSRHDRHPQPSSFAQTATPSGTNPSSIQSASRTSASGLAGTFPTSEHDASIAVEPRTESSADSPKLDILKSSPMASSVAAGDTGSQLSKLKHRWNFASLDCAAVVHRTNPDAKFASSILSEKKDRYMLSPCPQRGGKSKGGSQFVIVELCEEIKIDTIVLANYEFFSNMFKKFTVTAARQLTGRESDWTQLGVFRARNIRGQQVFRIPSAPRSEAFFRYVRIDFLEHFGSEYYCPVSLLRVYGITEMEEYKRGFEEPSGDMDPIPEPVGADVRSTDDVLQPVPTSADIAPASVPQLGQSHPIRDTADLPAQDEDIWRKHEQAFQRKLQNQSLTLSVTEAEAPENLVSQHDNLSAAASPQINEPSVRQTDPRAQSLADDTAVGIEDRAQCLPDQEPSAQKRASDACVEPRGRSKPFYHLEAIQHREAKHATDRVGTGSAARPSTASDSLPIKTDSASQARVAADAEADRGRRASTQRPGGVHSGQQGSPGSESVYRAIHRRLNALESNATLSHSYIEHSGRMLREVFSRMERRQESRMSDMLRLLNASNWQQIESLKRRQHVDLQRAIFEFDVHRQQADNERRALLREVQILAEEVLLEKRLSIAQLIMLLAVFVFVGLTRGSRTAPLLHAGFTKIGRSSKQSEGKTDSKSVIPASPNRAAARISSSLDAAQSPADPRRRAMPTQAHKDKRTEKNPGVATLALPPRHYVEDGHPSTTSGSLSRRPGSPSVTASPNIAVLRGTKSGSNAPRRRLIDRPRNENLIDMLSDPRAGSRLIMMLEALDALNRATDRRRLARYSTQHKATNRRLKASDKGSALHPGQDSIKTVSPDMVRRVSRAHRQNLTTQEERNLANGRRQIASAKGKKVDTFGTDDLAGMSSDWTERSENGEASEHAADLSDDEDHAIRAARTDQFSLDPHEDLKKTMGPDRNSFAHPQQHDLSNTAPVNAAHDVLVPFPVQPQAAAARADERAATARVSDLPSIAKADGHLSSSDSESEGGAWHRVLPRRIGHSSSLRKARQATLDGKTHRNEGEGRGRTNSEASDRQASPRPSSAHVNPFRSGKPAFNRFLTASTPDHTSLELQRNRRSGTPDTIREVKLA